MKKLVCMILVFSLFLMTSISVGAAVTDTAVTGKTVLQYEDWMLEEIEQGTRWELDHYVGSDETVYVPRFYNQKLIIALGDHSFMNNTSVKNVITSSPHWTIGEYAFIDCTSLESIELNFALDTIGIGAFSGTSSLKNINLQDSIITEIKPFTFLNSGIEEIVLPDTCTKIDNYAFGQCSNLTEITIPDSVTEIHEDAFKGSDNVIIYCYTDSAAHQYAVSKNIPFVLLDAVVPTEPPTEPPTIPVTEPPTEPRMYMLGDSDMDGVITIMDATVIQRVLVNYTVSVFDEKAANVTGDGLNIVDATLIQRHLADIPIPYAVGEWFAYDE